MSQCWMKRHNYKRVLFVSVITQLKPQGFLYAPMDQLVKLAAILTPVRQGNFFPESTFSADFVTVSVQPL